jgi:hypothetical protein
MEFKCHECGRLIFNRRLTNCEFCNAVLPPELLYTKEQREQADRQIKEDIKKQFEELKKEREGIKDAEKKATGRDPESALSSVMQKIASSI